MRAIILLALLAGMPALAGDYDELDARVAELEASAARRGTPAKTKFVISGQINRALMAWDDGVERDAYVVDNISSATRFNLTARTQISPDFATIGSIELESRGAASTTVNADNDDGVPPDIRTRYAFWGLESKTYGRVSLGQLMPHTNALIYYKLYEITAHTTPDSFFNFSFALRGPGGRQTALRWSNVASGYETVRNDYVRYDSPSFDGLVFSADWGDDDAWDGGATLDREWGDWKLAAAYGHFRDTRELGVSDDRVSVLLRHKPSGAFLHSAAGRRELDAAGRAETTVLYGMAGVKRPIWLEGATLLYVDAARYDNGYDAGTLAPEGFGAAGASPADDLITSLGVDRYGLGAMQNFAGDSIEVYAMAMTYRPEAHIEDAVGEADGGLRPWSAAIFGTRVKF